MDLIVIWLKFTLKFRNDSFCHCPFSPPPLCAAQCLAHVEAFIDFSEDELIEDGVLNRGMSTLCSPALERNSSASAVPREGRARGASLEESRVRPPFLFGILCWASGGGVGGVCHAAGKKAKTSNRSKDYFLQEVRRGSGGICLAFKDSQE